MQSQVSWSVSCAVDETKDGMSPMQDQTACLLVIQLYFYTIFSLYMNYN